MDEFAALARREGRKGPAVLVMTSGNRRGEPICLGNREARDALAGIADAFLFHNRDILVRVDDSVVRPRPAPCVPPCASSGAVVDSLAHPHPAQGVPPCASSGAVVDSLAHPQPARDDDALHPSPGKPYPAERPSAAQDGQQAGLLFFRRARGFVPRPISFAASMRSSGELCLPQPPPAGFEQNTDASLHPTRGRLKAPEGSFPLRNLSCGSGQSPNIFPFLNDSLPCVLGVGAELKNALCLTRGTEAFVGQHIGDMEDPGAVAFHEEVRDHLMRLLHVEPEVVVRDAHPDAAGSRLAEEYAGRSGLPVLRLQHHFAHAHAVLAENGHAGKALVLALDGAGFGPDGTLWGGELLFVEPCPAGGGPPVHARSARLAPLDLPGGDAAVREPWRIAHALLLRLGLIDERGSAPFPLPWLPEKTFAAGMLPRMLESGLNTPRASGCGRLFDAVSALLGLCLDASYEGQAAICLEEAQRLPPFPSEDFPPEAVLYPCPLLPDPDADPTACDDADADPTARADADTGSAARPERGKNELWFLDTRVLFRALCEDLASGTSPVLVARRFHRSLAAGLVEAAFCAVEAHGVKTVGLSGGCMLNMTLSGLLRRGLEEKGLSVREHALLPPGDGCIGFGQAVYGALVSRYSPERIRRRA
jgi:hydrogenase maturation factor HypF (carbamoyltransferase family)